MEDYKAALNHTLHSALPLHDFCKLFVIPLPGDWPTWYYTKKIIAQLPETSSQEHPYLSLIPEQGPFHVCLNINEDVIKSHHIVFARLYKEVFASDFPLKPKPFRTSLIITGTLCGWLLIRHKVLAKFKFCKDIEFLYLVNLLEEILPLVFFQYDSIFCSGNLELYINVMIRLAIIFIIWERHHYDRSTLSMLSDLYHQKINFPAYYNFKEQWLSIITEKKVEIWHSLLRNHISTHYSGDEIHDTAISLAASDTARKFHSSFVRPYTRGQSEKNMKLVAGNVFHNCKGQLYLALLFPFQKKSDTFFKNLINYNFLFSLNSNLFQKRHRLKLS